MGGASAPTARACCPGVAHCRRRGLDCSRSRTRGKYRRGKCERLPTPAHPARTGSHHCIGALSVDRHSYLKSMRGDQRVPRFTNTYRPSPFRAPRVGRAALRAYDSRAARAAARRVRFTLGTPAPMRSTPRGGLSPTWVASRNPPQSCRNGARSRTYRATSRPCCSPTVQARRKWIPTSMRENAFSRAASSALS